MGPFVLVLLVPIAIVAIVIGVARRRTVDPVAVARQAYLYGISLVALGMLVPGLAGLIETALITLVEGAGPPPTAAMIPGQDSLRDRISFSVAFSAIGLVAWVIHWGLAQRSVRRGDDAERESAIRKLFLYFGLFIGGLVLIYQGRGLVVDLVGLPFGALGWSDLVTGDAIGPLSWLAVTAVFWLYYARVASIDRAVRAETGENATLRRWFLYGLSFITLLVLLFGAASLLQRLWEYFAQSPDAVSGGSDWLERSIAGPVGSIVVGATAWYLTWAWSLDWLARRDEPDPESRSILRKAYIYVFLGVAVAWTVWNLGLILYGLVRSVLVPERAEQGWSPLIRDLGDPLAAALVFGIAWFYHARVVRHEAALAGERGRQATIRWIYEYLVALVGGITFSVGLIGTISTLLDLLVQSDPTGLTDWWRDRVSLFATLIVVGLPIWLLFWGRLQREAADPFARQSIARRVYLFIAFGLTVLTLLGSTAFILYQLISLALGDRWAAGQTSELLTAASSAVVAGLLLAYHFRVFRQDIALSATAPPQPADGHEPQPTLAIAVLRSTRPELLEQFRRDLASRTPDGVDLELLDVDSATVERIRGELRRLSS
jgi:hypothetical protein